jgi:hypothetical protein
MPDKDDYIWNFFKDITTPRPSSHLNGISVEKDRGMDFEQAIMIGTTKKRTLLVIKFILENGQKMILLKLENAPVVSWQHVREYCFPPKGKYLTNRKERIIKNLPSKFKISETKGYDSKEYEKYGISYLCTLNLNDEQEKSLDNYLEENKLDHKEMRIGEEVIVTLADLEKVFNKKISKLQQTKVCLR